MADFVTPKNFVYLALDLFTLAGPLTRSFEPRICFNQRWHALIPAIGVTAALFIAWDVAFTRYGIWGFNREYLTGLFILGLPLEEWLFFLVVPYACTFIYECLNYFWPHTMLEKWIRAVATAVGVVCLIIAVSNWNRLYTVLSFGLCAACCVWSFAFTKPLVARFARAYAAALIPFVLINGILTGSVLAAPIVWYASNHNTGIRLGTIPVEDAFYLMPLLWLVIVQYERLKARGNFMPPRAEASRDHQNAPLN
jgi:lycopene cyclase domain-containing protein